MAASVVLVMFWISLCFVDSSYGTLHRVNLALKL